MTPKKSIFIIALVTLINFCNAQNAIKVNYVDSTTLQLNGISLTNKTTIQDVTKVIGESGKVVEYSNGDKRYFYETDGMVVFTQGGIVKGIGINYKWDGDKQFPEKSFAGSLTIGELAITKDTKQDAITNIKTILFYCPASVLCASNTHTAPVKSMVAFKGGSLTQVVFLII